MAELLLELFGEEIPARLQTAAAADLRRLVTDGLVDAGLTYEGAKAFATPRRLALTVQGVSMRSPTLRSERKGPRIDAPDKAIQGFLRGAGLQSVEEAQIHEDPRKGRFYVATIEAPGREAADIVAELVPDILRRFPWPRTMRWGPGSAAPGAFRWIRPLRAVTCTFGPETEEPAVVPFEIDGLHAGRTTFGHRFHAPEPIEVRRFDDYADRLEAAKVVLDPERRREIIRTEARQLAFAQGLRLVEDDPLVEEVAGLVEWPVVLMGTFDKSFLAMPPEVIRLTIRANQKCFVLDDGEGSLSDRFVLVANIEAADGGKLIVEGNERVVAARLSDAVFFWQNDLSVPLESRLEKLRQVTFHEKIGSQQDRVIRLVDLAGELAAAAGADKGLAERAALLCKADLATGMVYEFPELQGIMGRYYALAQDEAQAVADAIAGHYRPQGPADEVPRDPVTVAVALADRLDLLSAFWAIDETPTGSKDPYALRRAALGVVGLVLANGIHLPLQPLLSARIAAHRQDGVVERVEALLDFFAGRLKVQLRDSGIAHDLIDAVFALGGQDDLLVIARRAEALQTFLDTADGADLLGGYRRAANILAAEEKKGTAIAETVESTLFAQEEEKTLFASIGTAEVEVSAAVERGAFEEAMGRLAALRPPVDAFFEAVLVNAEDASVRANRLALLDRLRRATLTVADFSRIEGRS